MSSRRAGDAWQGELLKIVRDTVPSHVNQTLHPPGESLWLGHAVLCARAPWCGAVCRAAGRDDLVDSPEDTPVMKQMTEVYNYHAARCWA